MLNKDKSNQNEKTRNRTRYLLKEKSMKNILKVRMLGGFTLEYKGKELVLVRESGTEPVIRVMVIRFVQVLVQAWA